MIEGEYKDARTGGATPEAAGLYVHLPFCRYHCDYCDFATVTGPEAARGPQRERYLSALAREGALRGGELARPTVDSVYLGGGTPSLLTRSEIRKVLNVVGEAFDLLPGASVSLESNPDDVDDDKVVGWLEAGVTRVTLGIQSLRENGLRALGRPGDEATVRAAFASLRANGVRDVGVDVIFGWPGQTERSFVSELREILALEPDHLSLYALETTSRTELVRRIERGSLPRVDEDLQASLYEAGCRIAAAAGLVRYEISNFSRRGHESAHNLKYWSDAPFIGLGMSAASYFRGDRWTNPRRLSEYVRWVSEGGTPEREAYDARRRASEAVVFGLRREGGVDLSEVERRHGVDAVAQLRRVIGSERFSRLVAVDGDRAVLSERGRLLADELFVELL